MHSSLLTTCLLAWILGGSSRSIQGTVGFAEGAVTKAEIEYSHIRRFGARATRHRPEKALRSKRNVSLEAPERNYLYLDDQGQPQTALKLLQSRLRYVFGSSQTNKRRRKKVKSTKFWIKPEPFRVSPMRRLEDYYEDDDDDAMQLDDDKYKDDNYKSDDLYSAADERCSAFLVSFLEGTTDAHDTCEGMMNAYVAAGKFTQNRWN